MQLNWAVCTTQTETVNFCLTYAPSHPTPSASLFCFELFDWFFFRARRQSASYSRKVIENLQFVVQIEICNFAGKTNRQTSENTRSLRSNKKNSLVEVGKWVRRRRVIKLHVWTGNTVTVLSCLRILWSILTPSTTKLTCSNSPQKGGTHIGSKKIL